MITVASWSRASPCAPVSARRNSATPHAAFARQRCVAAGLPESEAQAVIEATEIAAVLRAGPHDDDSAPPRSGHDPAGARDVAGEVAALERVARCYRQSRIVRAVVDQLNHEAASTGSATRIVG